MKIQQNISLKDYNTFGIDVKASEFISVNSITDLKHVLKTNTNFFIISGGSNMLLTKDILKPVLHINIKGIKVLKTNKYSVYIKANAGENWHKFVQWAVKNDFGGIENLSLIPGNVGTCPIQNIGAYGVEVKDTIHEVHAIDIKTQEKIIFKNKACNFGYRDSIFKHKVKGKYIITAVVFKLTKIKHHFHVNYGAIQDELKRNDAVTSLKSISKSIIAIRNSKLPDPKKLGNSGSFFKNPIVNKELFIKIKGLNENMPFYEVASGFKIPAGWLIEQCGFKGKRYGDAGIHKNQALVLVNYGFATGNHILELAQKIQEKVKLDFNISLEMEVNIF